MSNSNPNFENEEQGNRPSKESFNDSSADELPGFHERSSDNHEHQDSSEAHRAAMVGREIGPYKILQPLGHGGMGEVYMAEQKKPIRRRVALKLVKNNQDSKQILARFEAERQALAMMSHANIAKVFDAGEDNGQPYLAMELVKGVAITQYCDVNKLTVDDRLGLFIQVCSAVNHAHQKGIIHRDLSPSNILVEDKEGMPVPKVIDFGLAKTLTSQAKLTDQTFFTEFGRIVGKVHYMSPEQAEMNPLDVDTRTDIYSLGVILFELLTGTRPLNDETIKQNAFQRVLELIREQDTPKPSSRIIELSDDTIKAGQSRRSSPTKLKQKLHGDLDWIVMKSLEKDRARRYSGANEFGKDVQNYLNGDTVAARKPTFGYRFSKFIKKNRVAFFASTAVAIAIIAGLFTSTILAFRLSRALNNEKLARQQVEISEEKSKLKAREAAEEAERAQAAEQLSIKDKVAAEKAAKRSKDALEIFVDSFTSVDPGQGANAGMLAKDVLFKARTSLETSELDDEGKMEFLTALSGSFRGVGEYEVATQLSQDDLEIRRRLQGNDHPDTLVTLSDLAHCYNMNGEIEKAVTVGEEVVDRMQKQLGDNHLFTMVASSNLASSYIEAGRPQDALKLLIDIKKKVETNGEEEDKNFLGMLEILASAYAASGQRDKALAMEEELLEKHKQILGVESASTIDAMNNLAVSYEKAGRYADAIKLHKEADQLCTKKLGPDHPKTLSNLANMAVAYSSDGKTDKALTITEKVLESQKRKLGPKHPSTLATQINLGVSYFNARRIEDAKTVFNETAALQTTLLGADHPDTLTSLSNLAMCYDKLGDLKKSIELNERLLRIRKEKLGDDHPDTFLSQNNLASALMKSGDLDRAIEIQERLLKQIKKKFPADHPHVLGSLNNLGSSYMRSGRNEPAVKAFSEAAELMKKTLGIDHPSTLIVMGNLSESYFKSERYKEAINVQENVYAIRKAKLGVDHPATISAMTYVAMYCMPDNQFEKAIKLFEQAYELRKTKLGDESADTIRAFGRLGIAYKKSGDLERAIPVLEKARKDAVKVNAKNLDNVLTCLLEAYVEKSNTEKSLVLIGEMEKRDRVQLKSEPQKLADKLILIGTHLLTLKLADKAERLFEEGLNLHLKQSPDGWKTHSARSLLGDSYAKQNKISIAKTTLEESVVDLTRVAETIPKSERKKQILNAYKRLLSFFEENKDDENLNAWRLRREEFEKKLETAGSK